MKRNHDGSVANRPDRAEFERYADLFAETTRGHELYTNVPLGNITPKKRGDIVEKVVRRQDQLTNPDATFSDPTPGTSVNGKKRGRSAEKYDYGRDATKVEVKASALYWDCSMKRWCLMFRNVKRDEHDELRLAAYAPDGIHIHKHDGARFSTTGKATASSGGQIAICGPQHETDWRAALKVMLPKLGTFVAMIPFAPGV